MYKKLHIWVEGDRDRRFFETILLPLFLSRFDDVKVREYSQMPEGIIQASIKNCQKDGNDYIFVADMDSHGRNDLCATKRLKKLCKAQRKEQILKNHPCISEGKIILTIEEIESWYLAGLDKESCKELGIKYHVSTDEVTKEQFLSLMPDNYNSEIYFRMEILSKFNRSNAREFL